MPLVFYGVAEFAYPTVDAIIRSVFPNSAIRIHSSAGFAGVVQTFSWEMPGALPVLKKTIEGLSTRAGHARSRSNRKYH
jgi:hypothetical protein